ncbi:MAG: M14 family zinc carboxypeptidase [Bacteroidota bacterium]
MKKKIYNFTYLICVFFFLCVFGLKAQEETYSKVAVPVDDPFLIQQLFEMGMTVDHMEFNPNNSISFYVSETERQELQDAGIDFTVEIEDYAEFYLQQTLLDAPNISTMTRSADVANGFDLGSMGGFYTFDEVVAKLDEMKQDFPDLITEKTSIGTSVEGRDIWMVKISDNPDLDEEEPVAYFDAIHHAREPLSMATTINYMFWLLENYETNEQVKFLVDHREIYFVPVVNPDGYEYNRQTNPDGGGLWRKNRNPNEGSCVGVDLNRNYSFAYANNNDCSSPDPCSGIYRGEGPFSEPETSAVRDFLALVSPKTAFSTHSTAGSYLMPYGFDTSPPEFDIYSEWASVFLSENDYPYGVTFQMLGYTSCGTTRDYMHSEGIYGWTPEIDGQGFWPPSSTIFDLVGENVYPLFYQSWISGAFVDVQSHEFIGQALPGETLSLVVEAKNVGVGATAENVTVSVTTNMSGVTISDAVDYGAIAMRSRTDNSGTPFEISLDAGFTETVIDLTISTYQEGVLNDVLELPLFVGEKELLYFDDASSGAGNWTATGNGVSWGVVMDDAYSDSVCFGDSNGGNGVNNTLNYFELNSSFDLSKATSPFVTFMTKYSLENGDVVALQISVDDGFSWETLTQFTLSKPWHYRFRGLQDYAGQPSVRFRFTMSTDTFIPADGFYFDDFEVSNYTSEILEIPTFISENTIRVSPNPFSDTLKIQSDTDMELGSNEWGLFDIHGQRILVEMEADQGAVYIRNLETLAAGVYFLQMRDENGAAYVQKLVKL